MVVSVAMGLIIGFVAIRSDVGFHFRSSPPSYTLTPGLSAYSSASNPQWDSEMPWRLLALFLTAVLTFGLLTKLYRVWVLNIASPEEREPNGNGVRAWLRPLNLITVLGIALGAKLGMDWSILGTLLASMGLLLAYPLLNCALLGKDANLKDDAAESADERRRVLALVEAGKITAEEGAELIGALGQSRRVASVEENASITGNRRLMLLGALLVIVGFCLPWFEISINMTAEMRATMLGMQQAIPQMPNFPQMQPSQMPSLQPGQMQVPVEQVSIHILRGGDVRDGMGWIILAAGIGVAVLPLIWPTRAGNRHTQRVASFLCLGAGTILLMYLAIGATEGMTSFDLGFVLSVAGYVAVWLGAIREYMQPSRAETIVLALG